MNINSYIWHDERLRKLSKEGVIAFMYLMTTPHANTAGFYVLPLEYMAYDLGWTIKTCDEVLKELESHWLIKRDSHKKIVFVLDYLKHNSVVSPSQIKGVINALKEIPPTYLMNEFYEFFKEHMTKQTEKLLDDVKALIPEAKPEKNKKGRK